jgi:hypothetical protein
MILSQRSLSCYPPKPVWRGMLNPQQAARLLTEFQRNGSVCMSAMKTGMDRKTARKYLTDPARLSQPQAARTWRTRSDPLATVWQEAQRRLQAAPELEAQALTHCLDCCAASA